MTSVQGFLKAVQKPFRWLFTCGRCQHQEDQDPGFPEAQEVTYTEEPIPETFAAQSVLSLTDDNEVKEEPFGAAGKEKEGKEMNNSFNSHDADSDACPAEAECKPGPSRDRVPEPRRTSGEERTHLVLDVDELNSSSTSEDLHGLCKSLSGSSPGAKIRTANAIAQRHLGLVLAHFLESHETACNELMYAVLSSPHCDLAFCLTCFVHKANGGSFEIQDSEEQHLAKVKAVRGIGIIVRYFSDTQSLSSWLPFYVTTLVNILVSHSRPKEEGTSKEFKTYTAPGEVIDIFGLLLEKLNMVYEMNSKLGPA